MFRPPGPLRPHCWFHCPPPSPVRSGTACRRGAALSRRPTYLHPPISTTTVGMVEPLQYTPSSALASRWRLRVRRVPLTLARGWEGPQDDRCRLGFRYGDRVTGSASQGHLLGVLYGDGIGVTRRDDSPESCTVTEPRDQPRADVSPRGSLIGLAKSLRSRGSMIGLSPGPAARKAV